MILVKGEFLYEREIGAFIIDWFDVKETIKVKTSGSTGVPKTILLQKKAMIASAESTGIYFNLQAKQSALLCLSASYIAGKMMLVRALVLGLHLDVQEVNSNPLENNKKDYDFAAMVPLQAENSLHYLNAIRTLIIGGATISKELQTKLLTTSCHSFETYGMTETISHIAVKRVGEEWFSCLPNVTIYQNEDNCLVIKAPKIVNHEIITTDIVEIQANSFKWLGRKDNIINSGGIKLQPEIIEKKLAKFISKPFYISSIKDSKLGEKVILIIESENEIDLNFESLNQYEKPKEIKYVNELPKTANGKLKRQRF